MSQDERADQEFIGYKAAADYLGIKANTLSSYGSHGIGPRKVREVRQGQYIRPVFTKAVLDEWNANRPGQGARTDLSTPAA